MLDGVLRQKLQEIVSGGVLFEEPLSRHTSMGVGGKAEAVVFPETRDELVKTAALLKNENISFNTLGNGTNLIVRDGGYRGVVISLRKLNDLSLEAEAKSGVSIQAEAGVSLADVVGMSLREGLAGMEFCAGIPGSVGGAVRMNAGAYGWEIKDVTKSVTFLTGKGDIRHRSRGELTFGYRYLETSPDDIIVAATFCLLRGDREEIREKIERTLALRQEKHPLMYRNAGSVFRNPEGASAGRIIEETGLKGLKIGDAQISERHGNFIVNLGQAKAGDVLALIEAVQKKVLKEKGIVLDTEVHIIGEEGGEEG
jgi:UDP-N-acetylmuramate dehydrogenase